MRAKEQPSVDDVLGAIEEAKVEILEAERQFMAGKSPLTRGIHMTGFNRGFEAAVLLFMSPDPEGLDGIRKEIV